MIVKPCPETCAFDWVAFHKQLDIALAHMIEESTELPSKTDMITFAEYSNKKQLAQQASRDRNLEAVAMNIVHQLGDALYEALPTTLQAVNKDYFVTARQATNDRAIEFTKELITKYHKDNK